uniref:CSON006525 protein n=1 Tax=Culicoides sonorensis TaxID=179676 RepID=A0A336LS00_CULSO
MCILTVKLILFPILFQIFLAESSQIKWKSPNIIYADSKRLAQYTKVNIPDINFNLGGYFLKEFDQKCFREKVESHVKLVNEAQSIMNQIQNYTKYELNNTNLYDKIRSYANLTKYGSEFNSKSPHEIDIHIVENLHTLTAFFHNEMLKKYTTQSKENSIFKLVIELFKEREEMKGVSHTSGRAFGTGLLLSSFIGILQVIRIELLLHRKGINKKFFDEMKPAYENMMRHVSHTMKVFATEGTQHTFSSQDALQKHSIHTKFLRLESERFKIYEAPIMAKANNVITGVRFVIEQNTLCIQIKEGELLPFGQAKYQADWTPLPDLKHYVAPVRKNCKFLLNKLELHPDHVLVGLQFQYIDIKDDCFIILVVHSKKFDLLEGALMDRTLMSYVASSLYTITPEPQKVTFVNGLKAVHLRGTSSHGLGVSFKHDIHDRYMPYFDTQNVESVPASAHSGIEIFVVVKQNDISYFKINLISVNVLKHLGSFLQLEKYPHYYYCE